MRSPTPVTIDPDQPDRDTGGQGGACTCTQTEMFCRAAPSTASSRPFRSSRTTSPGTYLANDPRPEYMWAMASRNRCVVDRPVHSRVLGKTSESANGIGQRLDRSTPGSVDAWIGRRRDWSTLGSVDAWIRRGQVACVPLACPAFPSLHPRHRP